MSVGNVAELLQRAVEEGASDVHISVELPPVFRINGQLTRTKYPPLKPDDTLEILSAITTSEQQRKFEAAGELDFAYSLPGIGRFRVNAFRQRGSVSLAIRIIPKSVPTAAELGLPEAIQNLARKNVGLVLVTGPTGSGKSTTLAALVDLINSEKSCHIITLEDPIEYLHRHKKSVVNQREIGVDTLSFQAGLRSALREDPDVILIGEMRDLETIAIALTAAETGHLVFATLHTPDAPQTVDRIVDSFPPHQQQQVRIQLAGCLQGIVAQQLIPRADGRGRVAAFEILIATPAVRNLIREGKAHQLPSVIQTGGKYGMKSMEACLRELYAKRLITEAELTLRTNQHPDLTRFTQS